MSVEQLLLLSAARNVWLVELGARSMQSCLRAQLLRDCWHPAQAVKSGHVGRTDAAMLCAHTSRHARALLKAQGGHCELLVLHRAQ